MITIETADKALKSFYLDAVVDALDIKTNPFLAQLEKTANNVVGKDVRRVVRFGVNGGVSAGTEAGELPQAQGSNYVQFNVPLKNLYGTIEISDKAIKASANAEGAFVNLLNEEMDSLVKSASYNFGRMLFGDGTGIVGRVEDVLPNNVLKLETTKNIVEGMAVEIFDFNGQRNDHMGVRRVVRVSRLENEIVLSGPSLYDSHVNKNDEIYVQGSRFNELTGLQAIFGDSDTLYGVERENSGYMYPYQQYIDGDISEEIIQKAIDDIEERSGSKINFILCSPGVKRALASYFRSCQISLGHMTLNGGFDAMNFNGIPVVSDRFCPEGTMYLLNTNDFKIHQLCDWQWLEGEGGKILKQIANKPVFTATLVKYAELLCDRPGGQGALTGITEY